MNNIYTKHLVFVLLLAIPVLPFEEGSGGQEDDCICEDKSLCEAIKVGPRQEVYGFSTDTSNWKNYDWDKITTISVFGKWDKELLCHAHAKV